LRNKAIGIFLIIASAFFFSSMNVFVRLLENIPVMQKVFFRNAIAVAVIFIISIYKKEKISIKRENILFHFFRSLFGTLSIFGSFYAVDRMLLSDASMLQNLTPFFAIVASFLILHEKVSLRQWGLIIMAMCGAAFVIKPSPQIFQQTAVWSALGGAFACGMAYTFVRLLSLRGEKTTAIVLFFSLFSCVFTLPFMMASYTPFSLKEGVLLLGIGLCGCCGQFSVTAAYRYAAASDISIFDYTAILFAAFFGWAFFQQIADLWSYIGYAIIIFAALIMFFTDERDGIATRSN